MTNFYWMMSVLIGVLFIGNLVFPQEGFSSSQKPEKLIIDSVMWNEETESLEVEYLVQYGIGTAEENSGGFRMNMFIEINDGFEIRNVQTTDDVLDLVESEMEILYQGKNVVAIENMFKNIRSVEIVIIANIENTSGNLVTTSPSFTTILVSTPVEICDDKMDNDGDGLIDFADPDCLKEQP